MGIEVLMHELYTTCLKLTCESGFAITMLMATQVPLRDT